MRSHVCNVFLTMGYDNKNIFCLLILKAIACHIIISGSCFGLMCPDLPSRRRRPTVGHTHNETAVSLRWRPLWSHSLFCFSLLANLCCVATKQPHKVHVVLWCQELSVNTIQVGHCLYALTESPPAIPSSTLLKPIIFSWPRGDKQA